jgi:hypothetical protein
MKSPSHPVRYLLALPLLCGALLLIWRTGHYAPKLEAPVVAEEAAAAADGGSVQVVLAGANGKRILVGVRGSLDVPPNRFPVFLVRWYPIQPFPIYLPVGGEEEFCLVTQLVAWQTASNATNPHALALSEIIRKVSARQPNFRKFSC